MKYFSKALALMVLTSAVLVCFPSQGGATTILALQQDGGSITTVAVGSSLSSLSFSGTFGDFSLTGFGNAADNNAALSDIFASSVRLVNNSTASHTIRMWVSSQDFTLPAPVQLTVESGMSGTLNSGTLTASYQAYADKGNNLAGSGVLLGIVASCAACGDFTNGLQTGVFNGSTFDTGSATGTFNRTAGQPFSLTTDRIFTLSGGGSANLASHENVVAAPESSSLFLLGFGLVGVGFIGRRKLGALTSLSSQ